MKSTISFIFSEYFVDSVALLHFADIATIPVSAFKKTLFSFDLLVLPQVRVVRVVHVDYLAHALKIRSISHGYLFSIAELVLVLHAVIVLLIHPLSVGDDVILLALHIYHIGVLAGNLLFQLLVILRLTATLILSSFVHFANIGSGFRPHNLVVGSDLGHVSRRLKLRLVLVRKYIEPPVGLSHLDRVVVSAEVRTVHYKKI